MAMEHESPFICHIFVCMHDRKGEKKSCAGNDARTVREHLKQEVSARGWKKRVRVSQSGCLGPCDLGPNVMIYPQKIWFSGVTASDVGMIVLKVEEILKSDCSL